jgi:hypothetical protein
MSRSRTRLRSFLLGLLVGLALAPARGQDTRRMLRDRLAATLDALLRYGVDTRA